MDSTDYAGKKTRSYINPDSHMHGWPVIRRETLLLEILCPHGVGHPMPESAKHMDFVNKHKPGTWSVHGCDGCCLPPKSQCDCVDWGMTTHLTTCPEYK